MEKTTVSIDFTGCLNDKMKGFYRTKYTTPGGETRHAAVTQFEVCVLLYVSYIVGGGVLCQCSI